MVFGFPLKVYKNLQGKSFYLISESKNRFGIGIGFQLASINN